MDLGFLIAACVLAAIWNGLVLWRDPSVHDAKTNQQQWVAVWIILGRRPDPGRGP